MSTTIEEQVGSIGAAILRGEVCEADIASLLAAIKAHKASKVAQVNCYPGDTVTFNASIRPAYLQGLTAQVIRTNSKTVTVVVDEDPRARRFSGVQVRCPKSFLV